MTPKRLAEIRAAHAYVVERDQGFSSAEHDRRDLLAEVDRLRTGLRRALSFASTASQVTEDDWKKYDADLEALERELEGEAPTDGARGEP